MGHFTRATRLHRDLRCTCWDAKTSVPRRSSYAVRRSTAQRITNSTTNLHARCQRRKGRVGGAQARRYASDTLPNQPTSGTVTVKPARCGYPVRETDPSSTPRLVCGAASSERRWSSSASGRGPGSGEIRSAARPGKRRESDRAPHRGTRTRGVTRCSVARAIRIARPSPDYDAKVLSRAAWAHCSIQSALGQREQSFKTITRSPSV